MTVPCKDCKWFDRHPEKKWGRCNYNPPTALLIEGKLKSVRPIISEDSTCSKGEPK